MAEWCLTFGKKKNKTLKHSFVNGSVYVLLLNSIPYTLAFFFTSFERKNFFQKKNVLQNLKLNSSAENSTFLRHNLHVSKRTICL